MRTIIICIALCFLGGNTPVSRSFIETYDAYIGKHYHKFHKRAERHCFESFKPSDSLMFIPLLTIRNKIENKWEWNINASANNIEHASWDNLDFENRNPKEFILYVNNRYVKQFVNGGIGRKIIYVEINNAVSEKLMDMATQYKPDGIFMVYNIPGYFFITGESIAFIELINQELFYHEDALACLKQFFSQTDFIPVFSHQAL